MLTQWTISCKNLKSRKTKTCRFPQKEKEVILFDFIQRTYCKSLVKNISNRPAIAV